MRPPTRSPRTGSSGTDSKNREELAMAVQFKETHFDYAAGGNWIAWGHAVYHNVESRDKYCTVAIGCGAVNVWPGWCSWDTICGVPDEAGDLDEPELVYLLQDIEWQWNEDGELEDSFGEKCSPIDLPHEPYNFSSGYLSDVSEACEIMWHYYKFMNLQRP